MPQPTKSIEHEVKLSADLVFELPDLKVGHKPVRRAAQKLDTAYFDTSDLRLWRYGITLRHRMGERPDGPLWTLKVPEGESERTLDRTKLSWPGRRESIPPEAINILRGIVRRAVLKQIVNLETTRRRLILRDADGASAELADDTVTVVGGQRDGLRFRQLEVEVEADGGPMLDNVLGQLRAAGARPDGQPKLAIALGLPGKPATGDGSTLKHPRSSIGDVVRASLVEGLDRLLEHDYRLRLEAADPAPHDVHQARVATRRLRSELKLYRPLLDPVWLSHMRTDLEWLATTLGQVRDLDVLALGLGQERDEPKIVTPAVPAAGRDEIGSILSEERRETSNALAKQLTTERYLDLLDRLHAAGEAPPLYAGAPTASRGRRGPGAEDSARDVLPGLVRAPWRALRKRVRQAGAHPTSRDLHRIRIAAKQLRYASETAAPVIGKPASRTAEAAELLQTVLGEHHDAVAAEQWLRASVVNLTPAASFEAGLLAAGQRERQQGLAREWRRVWDKLESKKMRHWLG